MYIVHTQAGSGYDRSMRKAVRKGLTKARILAESKVLVEAGGEGALTMRALAGRLDVAAMAVYNHFEDRDAILDALADDVFEQWRQKAGPGKRLGAGQWRRRLKNVLMGAQTMAAEHQAVFRLAFSRPRKPASALALAAETVKVLEAAGLKQAQALTVYHTFVILLQGYPFWHEFLEEHGKEMAAVPMPKNWTAERQFEAIVDWLLESAAGME